MRPDAPALSDAARAWRIAAGGWLFGWYVKASFILEQLAAHTHIRLEVSTLPALMQSRAMGWLWWLSPLLIVPALWRPTRARLIAASLLLMLAALGRLTHLYSYNDATCTTSLWAGAWMLWLGWSSAREDALLRRDARWMARGVLALIFLGGALGKLTPEYLSGEVFYHYYFLERDHPLYVWARASLDDGSLRQVARYFSWAVMAGELSAPLVALLVPWRWAAPLLLLAMFGMIAGTTLWLSSVFACLIGLWIACMWWPQRAP